LRDENAQLKQGYTAIRNDMARLSAAAKEVEAMNRQIDRLCVDNAKLNDEYDELQKMFTAAAAHVEELELGTEELNNQIEDLEKYKERAGEIFVEKDKRIIAIWEEHGYKITDEQIDAAWGCAQPSDNLFSNFVNYAVLNALKKLGITRCEGCGGERGVGPARPSVRGDGSFVQNKCPDCNGRGWVMEADDE